MPPPPTIRAKVVDVRSDTPKSSDVFYVDTNVWYWAAFPRFGLLPTGKQPRAHQLTDYPAFLMKALMAGARLHYSPINFIELASIIESAEFEIHGGRKVHGDKKTFRHNCAAGRQQVVASVKSAWRQVQALGTCLPLKMQIGEKKISGLMRDFQRDALDGYDLLALRQLKQAKITRCITDDGDFAQVAGLNLFTANPNVLSEAVANGQTLRR